MKKLNFGCGSIQPEGWVNYDRDDFGQFTVSEGVRHPDLIDGSFDIIVAHCSLQMNNWHDIPDLLKTLYDLLKPGGVLRISLPDIEEGFINYTLDNIDWFPNSEKDIDLRFSAWLTWYSTTKTLLTHFALIKLLMGAGFPGCHKVDFSKSLYLPESTELDTRENECYFVEAMK